MIRLIVPSWPTTARAWVLNVLNWRLVINKI